MELDTPDKYPSSVEVAGPATMKPDESVTTALLALGTPRFNLDGSIVGTPFVFHRI